MVNIPEQAVEAGLEAYERVAGVNPRLSYPARFAVKAALAAAAPYMSGVKVKQLEWVETEFYMSADTEIGGYYAYLLDDHLDQSWRCIDLDGDPIGQFKDIESAKAAAQADFERRVRECIVGGVDVAAVRRQALEEAATLIDEGFDKAVGKSWRKDGKPSKNDSCPHDKFMYEDCEKCASAAIRALSSPDHAEAVKFEGDGWMPIETAPNDGTQILIEVHPGVFDVVCWSDGSWREGGNFMRLRKDPTRWRPLPSAPASEVAE